MNLDKGDVWGFFCLLFLSLQTFLKFEYTSKYKVLRKKCLSKTLINIQTRLKRLSAHKQCLIWLKTSLFFQTWRPLDNTRRPKFCLLRGAFLSSPSVTESQSSGKCNEDSSCKFSGFVAFLGLLTLPWVPAGTQQNFSQFFFLKEMNRILWLP